MGEIRTLSIEPYVLGEDTCRWRFTVAVCEVTPGCVAGVRQPIIAPCKCRRDALDGTMGLARLFDLPDRTFWR